MFILAISPGLGSDAMRWKALLAAGVDGLMIREKHLEARTLLDLTRMVQGLAPSVDLWVNGRLDVALAAGCGLHLPELYPEVPTGLLPISRPVHSEAQIASRRGSTQLLLGPIFEVPGKGLPWGVERLQRVLDALPEGPRVLALGGITPLNSRLLRHPRLDGIAVIRALVEASDPFQQVAEFRQAWA